MTRQTATLTAVLVAAAALNGCAQRAADSKNELPTLNVTHWSDRTELYMEYPPLVSGQKALFAVHLTTLADFKPVNAGRTRVEFTPVAGGPATVLAGPQPTRPGAFRVEGTLPPAGRYRWALALEAPGLPDRHDLGDVLLFADEAGAVAEAAKRPSDDPSAIAYLKEQQWTNAFATTPAREAELRKSMRVPAVLGSVPGGEAVVAAPASGRLTADRLPAIGESIRAGATLARLEPRLTDAGDRATLAADVSEAESALDAARVEAARAERLLADRAVPARRVDDARRSMTVAEARLKAAEARLAQRDEVLGTGGGAAAGNAFVLRAPIAGRVIEVMATIGASYDEGAPLFRIARTDILELKAFVPAAEADTARSITSLALEISGRSDPLPLRIRNVRDPGVLDAATKALPVRIEVENQGRQLLIGESGTAILYTTGRQRTLAVPKAAVLMEAGRPYVFVQVGGERFARRFVDVTAREGDLVGVRSGVKAGERVVTVGAYDVQLASAAKGLPAEGHVH